MDTNTGDSPRIGSDGDHRMAHIFISYSKKDADRARQVADLLRRKGWPVWWDPHIPIGETWADVIEKKLTGAGCVIVLWSKNSVDSRWVKKEARFALGKEHLIPAIIDDIPVPFEFADIETAMITDWPNESNPELGLLLQRVEQLLGKPTPPTHETASTRRMSGQQLIADGETVSGLEELTRSLHEFEGAGNWEQAEAVLQSMLAIDPHNVSHHVKMVELADRRGDRNTEVAAYLGLAAVLRDKGDHKGAHRAYERVLTLSPTNETARAALAGAGQEVTAATARPKQTAQTRGTGTRPRSAAPSPGVPGAGRAGRQQKSKVPRLLAGAGAAALIVTGILVVPRMMAPSDPMDADSPNVDLPTTSNPGETPTPSTQPPTNPEPNYDVFSFRGQTWLAQNLRVEVGNAVCYTNDQINCNEEGYLYRWDAAGAACQQLGSQWRLPSETDWLALTRAHGGAYGDDGAGPHNEQTSGNAAYEALVRGGSTAFNGSFGGKRLHIPEQDAYDFYDYGQIGYYWSADSDPNDHNVARGFTFRTSDRKLLREGNSKMNFLSVRCVRG